MKYSQSLGIAAALTVIVVCFLPWSFIVSQQLTVSGMKAIGTNFGRPGLFNIALCVLIAVMFTVPAIWSKRTNVFLAALNLAWSFRNYLLVSGCMMGECPQKQPALFALVGLSLVIQLMTLLPKISIPEN